ncbi:ABC transporter permease [Micromonospora sp. NPDC048830]|uniref:ABC transporter permease n=1 Tax=Micromonospora sp. NPDC048830 TaxID=3364257 RepID=UPI003711C79C
MARRLLTALFLMFLGSLTGFLLINLAPGDVTVLVAERRSGPGATSEDVARMAHELGMDRPLPVRYVDWVWHALQGDLGDSLQRNLPITPELLDRAGQTLLLVSGAAVFAGLVGGLLGMLGALYPDSWIDRIGRGLALLGASIPSFYLAALLILFFGLKLGVVPTFGLSGPASWILPWISLGTGPAGVFSRVVRVGLERAMAEPFAVTGFSKGFTRRQVLVKDALPNIGPSVLGVLATQTGQMVPGAVVIETVFAWQGVGSYFYEAVKFRDIPVLQSSLLVFLLAFVVLNTLVDIIQARLDPRIRRQFEGVRT